jgi:hypothetical protein
MQVDHPVAGANVLADPQPARWGRIWFDREIEVGRQVEGEQRAFFEMFQSAKRAAPPLLVGPSPLAVSTLRKVPPLGIERTSRVIECHCTTSGIMPPPTNSSVAARRSDPAWVAALPGFEKRSGILDEIPKFFFLIWRPYDDCQLLENRERGVKAVRPPRDMNWQPPKARRRERRAPAEAMGDAGTSL